MLQAWGEALLGYGERASYRQVVKARKLAEVLARADRFNLPQCNLLLAVLNANTSNQVETPETLTETPAVTNPQQVGRQVVPRRPALDFSFRSMKSGQSFRLSDFRGKVVVLMLGEFADDAFGPSRIERFFEPAPRVPRPDAINPPNEVQVFDFYNGRGDRYSGNRVTVLDAQGQIVRTSDFLLDSQQTVQRANEDQIGNYTRQ